MVCKPLIKSYRPQRPRGRVQIQLYSFLKFGTI